MVDTLYIDIYFLINFTVDILSLYFAGKFSKVKTTVIRLIAGGGVGALFACLVALFVFEWYIYAFVLIATAIIISYVYAADVSVIRRVKLFFSFIIFETLIGGAVSYGYGILDKYLYPGFTEDGGAENRNLLILALTVLLSFGIIKLLFYVFFGIKSEKNVTFTIVLFGKKQEFSAMVDSGNLLRDPMSSYPVILVKRASFRLIPSKDDLTSCEDPSVKCRIRLIPAKGIGDNRILVGIRPDYITKENGEKIENVIIAFDNEEGNYGGYSALVPESLIYD